MRNKYPHWDIYVSNRIIDTEYSKGMSISEMTRNLNCKEVEDLHLSVSLRSFRSENVSGFVKSLLDINKENAKILLNEVTRDYPIVLTRDLEKAKVWVKSKAKGSQRYGLTASSGARRLRKYGVWVQNKIDAPVWF